MNIDGLVKRYFGECTPLPVMEMFDSENIHAVYKDILNTLKMQPTSSWGYCKHLVTASTKYWTTS